MHTDIKKLRIIERLPARLRPYAYLARVDRPVGVWLLLLPGLWGIALAPGGWALKLWLGALFCVGAFVMRSAGCVINDVWDRDLDSRVERTKGRPLAAGDVSLKAALILLAALLFLGFLVLVQMNGATILLGFVAVPMVIIYPLMKRFTFWPQAFLGLTFNFSALMGWSAVTGSIGGAALLLYVSGVFWTLGYDTVYAHQDKEDDALIGVKSTALKLGARSKIWVGGFYAASLIFMGWAVFMASSPYALVVMALPALHMAWQIKQWDMDDAASSLMIFKSNRDYGALVLIICILAGFLAA